MPTPARPVELSAPHLESIPEWTLKDNKLYRRIEFGSFPEAIAFMCQAAFTCERMDHHPEWLNVYKVVEVWLTSHDQGRVTERDVQLAQALDAQLQKSAIKAPAAAARTSPAPHN